MKLSLVVPFLFVFLVLFFQTIMPDMLSHSSGKLISIDYELYFQCQSFANS